MILETHNLSMRFGGVAAVDLVNLAVEPKTIFSVIGPNGAGKTTLFNCITGLETPTAGSIRFAGQDLRRRWGWRVAAACLASGVLCALLSAALALDLNGLWRAAIRRPASLHSAPFSWGESWRQATGYLRGELAVERLRHGRWQIVTADGRTALGIAARESEAKAIRDELESLSRQTGQAQVVRRDDQWVIDAGLARAPVDEAPPRVSVSFASRAAAQEKLDLLIGVAARRLQRRRLFVVATGLGAIVGATGAWAAWRRSRWTPDLVARAGVARTFQNLRLFKSMTARENICVAIDQAHERSWRVAEFVRILAGARLGGLTSHEVSYRQRSLHQAEALLRRVRLADKADRLAGQLSYGDQRRLEIARALALQPRLLLLDEPAAGMNPTETAALIDLVRGIRDDGITVILIEHQMELVMGMSDRIAVLDGGRKIAEGTPEEVRRDPEVLKAYLGEPA